MEIVAIAFALVYLWLAARQSAWCWLAGAVSCTIYTYLMFNVQLYMEALLQLVYVGMAAYGWWQWQVGAAREGASTRADYSWQWHVGIIIILALIASGCAWMLSAYTNADQAWLDSFTTVYSLFATWLLARKLFSTWLYWLVIDSVYIYLYFIKGFEKTSGLFALYVMLVVYAMWNWQRGKKDLCSSTG